VEKLKQQSGAKLRELRLLRSNKTAGGEEMTFAEDVFYFKFAFSTCIKDRRTDYERNTGDSACDDDRCVVANRIASSAKRERERGEPQVWWCEDFFRKTGQLAGAKNVVDRGYC
jgi:hypothetical protein